MYIYVGEFLGFHSRARNRLIFSVFYVSKIHMILVSKNDSKENSNVSENSRSKKQ